VDLEAERALADVLVTAAERGLVVAAHDLSDGGLAIALAESCLAGGTGCVITPPADAASFLFSESAARALLAAQPGTAAELVAICEEAGVPAQVIGQTGGSALEIAGLFSVPLAELAQVHRGALPRLFG
jgi:phosphoribosylformylglycinamidine synthase